MLPRFKTGLTFLLKTYTVATTNVTAPSPRALGEAANCTTWGYVYNFTDCSSILGLYDLTLAELYTMNPSVESDCSGLDVGTYYCVSWFENGENPDDWGYEYTNTVIPTATVTSSTIGGGVSTPAPVQVSLLQSNMLQLNGVLAFRGCY